MSIVAVVGDCATTTTLALASTWPSDADVLVLEADPRGGSMAAWLDIPVAPSLSAVVTRARAEGWPVIDALSRVTASGIRLVPAPVRATEASRAVAEATTEVLPLLSALADPTVLLDVGPTVLAPDVAAVVTHADLVLVVHRQARQSARAAGVRLERTLEQAAAIDAVGVGTALAVIGDAPFDPMEIAAFLDRDDGSRPAFRLPDDPLAAAVLAGRTGVSRRRLSRLPLMRAAALAASELHRTAVASHRRARRRTER
jgi:hypothetical protein